MSSLNQSGRLELVIGCMFSGKSTELIHKKRQHQLLDKKVMMITHKNDDRYEKDAIVSHNMISTNATSVVELMPLLQTDEYDNANVVFIEEGQFFQDLYEFVVYAVEHDHKHVIVGALDGDYQRKPFWNVLKLVPMADHVEKKSALCMECKDGTLASFSKRLISSNIRNLVGHQDKYIPVCRFHYNAHT